MLTQNIPIHSASLTIHLAADEHLSMCSPSYHSNDEVRVFNHVFGYRGVIELDIHRREDELIDRCAYNTSIRDHYY